MALGINSLNGRQEQEIDKSSNSCHDDGDESEESMKINPGIDGDQRVSVDPPFQLDLLPLALVTHSTASQQQGLSWPSYNVFGLSICIWLLFAGTKRRRGSWNLISKLLGLGLAFISLPLSISFSLVSAMDDLPLQKIQISGPTLASIIQRFSSSPGDVDGLLFGRVTHITPSNFSDDDPSAAASTTSFAAVSPDSPTFVATITSFFCSSSTATFYDSTGQLNVPSLVRLISSSSSDYQNHSLIGWFSGRRKTPLRPSMRESSVTSSLSSKIQFSFQVDNSPKSYTLPPCIFLLLATPFQDQLIHTHEYRAYQFRLSTESFEPITLDIVNIGPAFRGHYGAFCPNSPFPALTCELRGLNSMAEDKRDEGESLKGLKRVSKDQKELDMCAEDFDIGRLGRLMGQEATNYTVELEDLYKKMLSKLDGLARLVEKSSVRVLEQENHNLKLRCKVAGLE